MSDYKVRYRETQARLDEARDSLVRVLDIIDALTKQISTLSDEQEVETLTKRLSHCMVQKNDLEEELLTLMDACLRIQQEHPSASADELAVYVEPGSASPTQIGELLAEISALYRIMGGYGISFVFEESRNPDRMAKVA